MDRSETFGDGKIALRIDGDIATVVIDNPPVNAGSHDVRRGLLDAFAAIAGMDGIAGVVLAGANGTFVAGSDLKEFGAPLGEPQLPAVIAAIEATAVPVVAALDGAALGGGFELSLGCDGRVAAPGTVIGLPEVGLGIVPGAGGTQRMPRLAGVPASLGLICGARRIAAEEALRLGLIDAVAADDLRMAARDLLRRLDGKRRVRDLAVSAADPVELEAAKAAALKAGRNRPAAIEAARLVELSATVPFDEALAEERRVFQEIRSSPEAVALRHVFFAERAAGRVDGLSAAPRRIERAAVIGAGTMGAGIAYALLRAGFEVVLIEQTEAALAAGRERVEGLVSGDAAKGRIGEGEAAAMRSRLSPVADLAAVATVDLVVEAVFEDMAVKSALLAGLGQIAAPQAILASNTSYLDLDALAAASGRPDRVVGLHFFSPAHVMKLLEVVRGAKTSDETLATGLWLGRKLKKTAIVAGVGEGFVGNRLYAAYRGQAEMLVEDGALPWQVDAALEAFGMAMGPFAVSDLSGLDIAFARRKRLAATRDPAERYVKIPDMLCEAGRLGRKTGAGWYRYDGRKRQPDPEVERLILAEAEAAGRERRAISDEECRDRCLAALVNEAALVLDETIAQRPGDVDVAFVNGYGFPRWRGGPLWWAAHDGRDAVLAALPQVEAAVGQGFRRGDVEGMLEGISG
ncbi:3-hydroxyacyl-CoA dehydrogenase NAD-binding domain-containing protein [Jiella avicenniae]|uniref:3-hydroxyacyl-CoA dehydrogenase NAD-binding domain-containing protein n=1 Tax=Jiella avicenniae TaxID=2907202 RepID=A0A9X1P246_9HYPH|nr:3-hydroxyacyl-CoA dehydrogenase NAD-binding domain-containing protein [Jiella avicenniae]MCE7030007.1 3-hydroxyacyl-CoA dehydrogenase NAD-binding domain-containing protein [Jiella avicenniae]